MKLFAFFLPQFHEIPENNKWWGNGFTEWTNVKNATPIYKGHIQPKKPLDNNYYNLLDRQTVEWQTSLMNQYGVDGLIYYHYYFAGKKLLEKPAENLLQWKDINQPFFFCWANHTWYKAKNGKKEELIKQTYGTQRDWEEHFQYLLPFFKDARYEKINNKPVLMVFISDFKEKHEMFNYFEKRCKENKFNGISIIETYSGSVRNKVYKNFHNDLSTQTEFEFFREPSVSLSSFLWKKYFSIGRVYRKIVNILANKGIKPFVLKFSGSTFYKILQKKEIYRENIVHGIFFEWDNTPRHGSRGFVITPPSNKNFVKAMNAFKNNEYVFINAWNEWAEGMMLEPTDEYGYRYLSWIKEWKENSKV